MRRDRRKADELPLAYERDIAQMISGCVVVYDVKRSGAVWAAFVHPFDSEGLKECLSLLLGFRELRELNLVILSHVDFEPNILQRIKHLKKIKAIGILNYELSVNEARAISHLQNLIWLRLSRCKLSNNSLKSILDCESLRYFSLGNYKPIKFETFPVFSEKANLREIKFQETVVSEEELAKLIMAYPWITFCVEHP